MTNNDELIKKLLPALAITDEHELDCDQLFEALDIYAEAELADKDAAELLPLVKHHLMMCADCEEEYQALLRILEAS
jgi:hypothetical protein